MPKRAVPEGEGKRVPVMTRVTLDMRERLEQAAAASGRSLGQEVEFRLNRDFSWEASSRDLNQMIAEANAMRSAERIQAIRDAGFQLVREAGGHSVNVSLELLHSTADGIVRNGFLDEEADKRDGRWHGGQKQGTEANATPSTPELSQAIEEAVVRALKRVLPPTLTNRPSPEGEPNLTSEEPPEGLR